MYETLLVPRWYGGHKLLERNERVGARIVHAGSLGRLCRNDDVYRCRPLTKRSEPQPEKRDRKSIEAAPTTEYKSKDWNEYLHFQPI